MTTVAVLDYGMGNLRSVCKALEHVAPKARVLLTTGPADLGRADRVVFPGQGAIAGCMTALAAPGLRAALLEAMRNKPFLGVCLGLQALFQSSEEGGGTECLGILPGHVRRFPGGTDPASGLPLKIPHMGWNQVHHERAHPLWSGIGPDERFYFVHSYYVEADAPADIAGTTDYGVRFTSAAGRANMFAVQFHPEKSQHAGLKLLENFMNWNGESR
jgi:glutamine amidotransferase